MINDCCKITKNLELQPGKPDPQVRKCKVCGRRHYKLLAEPGVLGIVGKDLGR